MNQQIKLAVFDLAGTTVKMIMQSETAYIKQQYSMISRQRRMRSPI